MKLIGIGDAVVDYYQDQGKIYPGGSVVNAAVFAKRNGAKSASFLGLIGTDVEGDHLINSLLEEGIDVGRVRRVKGPTGKAIVTLDQNGDRVFVGTNRDNRVQSLVSLSINNEDLEYIRNYDIVHSAVSINVGIEKELHKIADKPISFDFSSKEYWTKELLIDVCPYVNYAFFSGSNFSELEVIDLIEFVHKLGVGLVGVTRGEHPAFFSETGKRFVQIPYEANVVDTMGAGDSFIASFLTHYHSSSNIKDSLHAASEFSANVCGYYGAFGYGFDI
jgi:fructoselysine 6-kinase